MSDNIMDDIVVYKELVLSGIPKLFTNTAFDSEEQKNAVMHFTSVHGIPSSAVNVTNLREAETREDFNNALAQAVVESVRNYLRGIYGI